MKTKIYLIVSSVIATIFLVEGAIKGYAIFVRKKTTGNPYGFLIKNDLHGYASPKTSFYLSEKRVDGELIYSARYHFDDYGRRISGFTSRTAKYYLLFFGDSFTFGEGVQYDETLSSQVSSLMKDFNGYNYGFSGYGPQHLLTLLQNNIRGAVKEKEGGLIYTYLDWHVNRVIGDMYTFNKYGMRFPFYDLDNHGRVIYKGNFLLGRPLLSLIYLFFKWSEFGKILNVNHPKNLEDRHFELAAKILLESKQIYLKDFQNGSFFIMFFPGTKNHSKIIPWLKKFEIDYFDFSNLFDFSRNEFSIQGDGHPNALAYEKVSKTLQIALKTKFKS